MTTHTSTGTTTEASTASLQARSSPEKRNPAPAILVAVVMLLMAYYVVLWATGALRTSTAVPLDGQVPPSTTDYVTLQLKIQDVDLTNRVIGANLLPVPHGSLVGKRAGEMARSLRIELMSGGVTTSVVTFPGESIIDPTSMSLALERGDAAYPFDRPTADFAISVQDDRTGKPVPFDLTIENSARPWTLSAVVAEPVGSAAKTLYPVKLDGHRDALNITLVGFYVLAILLTTLIAVVTIGSAIVRLDLQFSNIIWLSATMLSFPALRSAMPGAPPIGTGLDFVVFFPCICLIAAMLVWTGVHLLSRENHVLRQLRLPGLREVRVDTDDE